MRKARNVLTGVAALLALTAIGACGNSATNEATTSSASSASSTTAATSASVAVTSEVHNHDDMLFAHMMIPHHRQAIEMSDIILAKQGIDPRVVDLATQIKAAQGPEIQPMQGWLDQWAMGNMPGRGGMPGDKPGDMPGMHDGMGGGMGAMDGMMSPAEMDALKNANGVDATKLFLNGMIKHHQGAITMSQDEIKNGEFPDAIALAKSIIESQQKEIDTMNQILGSL